MNFYLPLLVSVLFTDAVQNVEFSGQGLKTSENRKLHDMRKRSDDTSPLQTVVTQMANRVDSLETELQAAKQQVALLQAAKNKLESQVDQMGTQLQAAIKQEDSPGKASTFIRWGHSACPSYSTKVYSGYVGGSWYDGSGASANHLCLTDHPVFTNLRHDSTWYNTIYGTEYEYVGNLGDEDVVCAMCEAPYSSTIMIPGTNQCPRGWLLQYWGYVTGNSFKHTGAGEYLCVDNRPVSRDNSADNRDGSLLYYTVAKCGSLKCPPYHQDNVVTCVVCSK